jgi:hypothetical protein
MDPEDITKLFENNSISFEEQALSVFHFQYAQNDLYRQYVDLVNHGKPVTGISSIPFLPVEFFKTKKVKTTSFTPELVFESSGTTGMEPGKHFLRSAAVYEESFNKCFRIFYGNPEDYCILALLPSYLERGHSSLVYMVKSLMNASGHAANGFFLNNPVELTTRLKELEEKGQKTLLIGVSYALLDFAERISMQLNHTTVMETGGMKGRRREILRAELHAILKKAFGIDAVHSEYGMTELLSQAYAKKNGIFFSPPWMKILIRDEDDPAMVIRDTQKTVQGGINIIDLANIYSCSFIATSDIGKLYPGGSFEVLGRMDNSDIRGCSLLAV